VTEIAAKMLVDVGVAKDLMARVGREHGVIYRAAFDRTTHVFAMLATMARPAVASLVLAKTRSVGRFR
jgi:hypothetical protein